MLDALTVVLGAAANLGLAVIPLVTAHLAALLATWAERWGRRASWCLFIPLGAAWLVSLPGASLLTVDWWHTAQQLLRSGCSGGGRGPGGLDDTLSLALRATACALYAGAGLIAFALAIRPIHQLARRWTADAWMAGVPVFLYASLGACLSLAHPSHSPALAIQPLALAAAAPDLLSRPALLPGVVAFALFLWLAYAAVDIWVDGLVARWRGGP